MANPIPSAASGHTITSPRLVIRTARPADGEALVAYWTNPANFPWEAEKDLTLDKMLARIDKWAKATEAGKSAFMVIVLRETDEIIGFGGFNNLPYTRPLGGEPIWRMTLKENTEEGAVLVADIGISIDHRYQRKGYAREAICAQAEYGFETLGCAYAHLDTAKDNEPLRSLMRDLGIKEGEGDGGEAVDNAAFVYAGRSYNYDFDKAAWEEIKNYIKRRGRWPL
ncbi:hypothetical protein VPNG_02635 [Cytospora leucostoma]|uniref:N-acetyltransferase domain-containing protein n=1 Tax=Cytospora leucostoma TaxID=1230097 RepID=A0A423XHQ8_9PEZI|nr:hypothetical protein VPNG_02635 [Cytospora leucostoma]